MNLLETILAAQNGGAAQHLGRQFGLGESQTSAALSALVPALAAGFSRNMQQEGGLASLDDASSLQRAETVADGNGILGHIFGSKDVSRQVAQRAAQSSGVSPDILAKMLPVVAAMAMGSMAKRTGGSAQGAGLGAGLPGGDLLGMLTPMLDADRDGSVMDDVAGMLGKFMGGR
jgi:hypothetical protein